MNELVHLLSEDAALLSLKSEKQGLSLLSDIEETLLISCFFTQQPQNLVIVKSNSYTAQQLYYHLQPLLKNDVLLFDVEQSLRVEAVAASPDMYAKEMETLSYYCLQDKPKVLITNPASLIRYLPSKDTYKNHIIHLKLDDIASMDSIKQILIEDGYKWANRVDQPLTFALRGSIIDVFSINNDNPIRIEFFDDVIDSIRYFDCATQKTIELINECTIVPASSLIYDKDFDEIAQRVRAQLAIDKAHADDYNQLEENIQFDLDYLKNHVYQQYLYRYYSFIEDNYSILDYIDNPYLILSTVEDIDSSLSLSQQENDEYIQELFIDNKGLNYYSLFNDYQRLIAKYRCYKITTLSNYKDTIKSNIKLAYFPLLPLDKVEAELIRLSDDHRIHLCINKEQYQILANEFSLDGKNVADYADLCELDIFEGFNYNEHIYLTAKELFGLKIVKGRYETKFKEATVLSSYQELKVGDYVVHNQYGIGRYEGIVVKEINNKHRDYLQVRYRDNDMLMVPLEQFKLIRKYVGSESVGVKLSKLGSNSWSKAKEKIKDEVNDIAQRLIFLYSQREQNIGYAFSKDDDNSRQFEQNFPYQLTSDQIKAIAEVKYDMEQPKPMDRLLCGDVGFGKTEVAMVAAFKAVKDLKQVAYLCPTTILSRQHYNSFVERFKGFPIKIAILNRYVIDSQQKQIIKDLKEGKIDILIGTHRIISEDVSFADLGLLIIDEEQRFGVVAKEKIKEIKKSIDVLSLSATPIPRTLQMSLVGVMSLSQLETPPRNRMPIQTYVVEKNDSLIKEVIQRELARDGQVFYLHNNVSDIYEVARKIKAMVPQANIGIGHGQMNREEIEDVMYRFVEKQYNILICTTIIETGIDIPNVNTILIENAENFGLAQLYQIRGRVGRSDRVAYAYLMYAAHRCLSEVATQRLQAIKDFTELGSGYKIALRDLTIRGAGDLLGEKQAGFINTVGMSLYLDMLNSAINQAKGIAQEYIENSSERKVNDLDGYIPEKFVNQDYEKIIIYQKLDKIKMLEELMIYQKELIDYYGKLPISINNLFEKKHIEVLLNNPIIEDYISNEKENRIILTKESSAKVDGVKLFTAMDKISSDIQLKYSLGKIMIVITRSKKQLMQTTKVLEVLNENALG